jgi:hypothetical protein
MTENYASVTEWLTESFNSMKELEEQFMYHSANPERSLDVILELTQLYFESIAYLNKHQSYENYLEFDTNFRELYTFVTSHYFLFKLEALKRGK